MVTVRTYRLIKAICDDKEVRWKVVYSGSDVGDNDVALNP